MSSTKRNRMPGLRQKGGIWQIEKRCKFAEGGWLRESTGTASRSEAEAILIRRLAEVEEEAGRRQSAIYTFEEAGFRYLEEIAEKPSADDAAMHLDQLFPHIGQTALAQVHDGTLKPFIDHERERGLAPKSINNALRVVSAVLNRAARVWRDEDGRPWLTQAPAKISLLSLKGKQARAYTLSWEEQGRLFKLLPRHLADAALYGVNTGCREQEICQLRWDWEVKVPGQKASVFVLPETLTKTGVERVVVLNRIAQRVVDSRRGMHKEFVFTYRGKPLSRLHNSAWKRAWSKAKLPTGKGILKGIHNLRHTCASRLRAAGVTNETRKAILGHANGDITTHCSAAELNELLNAVEKITKRGKTQSPTLTLVSANARKDVGKLSEMKKGEDAKRA